MYSLQVLGFIAAISATVATAVPTTVDNFHHPPRGGGVHPTVGQVQNQCGNGQTIACCNSDSSSKGGDNNVLGSLGLNQLLGGNCQTLAVPVLAVPLNDPRACGNNIAACCEKAEQSGAININAQCNPIDLEGLL